MTSFHRTEVQRWAKEELERCLTFWLQHGRDMKHGGIYTCLDKKGRIYSTDKSVWMQGRAAWTFSALCRQYGVRSEWIDTAESCLEFLENHCKNRNLGGRMYFTVTEDGRPLRQRRYCFSECFYTLANAEYYGVTGKKECLERARRSYEMIWHLTHGGSDPVGMPPKIETTTRRSIGMAEPMIYLNLTSAMYRVDAERRELYAERARLCRDEITLHYHPELHCMLESVAPDGTAQTECSAGRVVNPGHDIECAWFLIEAAEITGESVTDKLALAEAVFADAYEIGWDREFGGLKYFVDALSFPPEAYEHDMKLWWPHNELLIASLKLYLLTGKEQYAKIFEETRTYCDRYFCEKEYGEWWGYLRRDNIPTAPPCKGSTFKGPFHVPRCLMMIDEMLALK